MRIWSNMRGLGPREARVTGGAISVSVCNEAPLLSSAYGKTFKLIFSVRGGRLRLKRIQRLTSSKK